ncbi:MAG TPA: sigma factor-like helix-turn-helix DNA-binding protein [Armatimonadota bacterium]|nr:sigma factor-like helix-turn-helix DNA-binding protein [Armatimonadota bacterium]
MTRADTKPPAAGTAAAEEAADGLLRETPGVYTARQLREKARRETPVSGLAAAGGEYALDAEDWLTLRRLGALQRRLRLTIFYDRLDDSERRVMIRRLDGARQREIAAELGVSQQRVSRIFARAVVKCRDASALYEGSPLEGEFWWQVREAEKSVYRRPERVWRHQRAPDRALVRSLRGKGGRFLFFVNVEGITAEAQRPQSRKR